jgi:glutamyl-tRNA reductase
MNPTPTETLDSIGIAAVAAELVHARSLHAPMNSAHEAYSVILEELEEFWEEVKKKRQSRDPEKMRRELIQIAAMAIRASSDLSLTVTSEKVAGWISKAANV